MEILGDTIEKIAAEKAGIIKMGYQLLLLMKKTGHFLLSKELRKKKIPSLRAEIARPYNFKKYENKIDFLSIAVIIR